MNEKADFSVDLRECFRGAKKSVTIAGLIGVLAGSIYALTAPKWYSADCSIVPVVQSKSGGLGQISGIAASFGVADVPIDVGGGSDVDRISAVLHSRSVTDSVVSKFNLLARYNVRYLEDARESVWKYCATKVEKKANLITLSCEDKSPAVAVDIVAYLVQVANQVARRTSTSSAAEERRFLESRLAQARAELEAASSKLRGFQEQNNIISLPDQAKAIVSSVATLRAEMLEKQMQLAFVDGYSAGDEPTRAGLRRQVSILQNKVKTLEETRPAASGSTMRPPSNESRSGSGLFPPAMAVPLLQYQLEQLLREQKMQEALFALLTQRYELARVNEARDTSTFLVLDSPVLPTKKVRPRRLFLALEGLALGIFIGLLLTVFRNRRSVWVTTRSATPS